MPKPKRKADFGRRTLYIDPTIKLWIERRAKQKRQTLRVVADELLRDGIAVAMKREKTGGFGDDPPAL